MVRVASPTRHHAQEAAELTQEHSDDASLLTLAALAQTRTQFHDRRGFPQTKFTGWWFIGLLKEYLPLQQVKTKSHGHVSHQVSGNQSKGKPQLRPTTFWTRTKDPVCA